MKTKTLVLKGSSINMTLISIIERRLAMKGITLNLVFIVTTK